MRVTKEEAEQETRRVPVRTLAFIIFTVLTSTLISSAGAQPPIPTPPLPPIFTDLTVTPSELERGDNVTISIDIRNLDSQSITYGVTMWIENAAFPPPFWPPYDVTLRIWVDLEAYESKTVSQNITLYDIGEYHVWVEGLTGIFTVGTWPPLKPAEFVVSELGVSPAEVEVGEDVIFGVLVTNIGETEGSYTVEFKVDGETVATKKVTLAAARGLPVLVPFKTLSAGTYQVSVGDLTEIFDVRAPLEPAEFEFSNLRIFYPGVTPPEVEAGQTVTVTVSIEAENVGDLKGDRTVELKVSGEVVDSKGVTLEGGASATVLFELTRGEGTHEVEMEGFTESFTVNPKPTFWDKIPGFPYESITLGLIAVIIILWYARARKF